MTYAEFKNQFDAIFWRDGLHSDERFFSLFKLSAQELLNSVDVLELVEVDENSAEVFRRVNDKYFIRTFNTQNDENSLIDLENETLINALLYLCASKMSIEKANVFKSEFFKALNSYLANSYDESCLCFDDVLEKNGFKRPYEIYHSLNGTKYEFEENFIKNLDAYLADIKTIKNLSHYRFIKLFMEFQNGFHQNRQDLKELDLYMSKKIIKG